MSLQKEFIRDGKRRIIGSVTTAATLVRSRQSSETNRTTSLGAPASDSTLLAMSTASLISINSADAGLLIGKHNKK